MEFSPVKYLPLAVICSTPSPDSFRLSASSLHVDGKILDIDDGSVRILLRRKLRHTVTRGSIYIGFVLQEGDQISTEDDRVQVVRVRMESTTGESWEATIDPGFRALQHLSRAAKSGLDISPHSLFAKNDKYAVYVTHRTNKAISLTEMLADDTSDLTEETVRGLFIDVLKVR